MSLSDNGTERGSAGWMFVAYALPGATALGSVRRFAKEEYTRVQHNWINHGIGDDDIIDETEGFHGFNTSIAGNVSRYVGLKFDLSGHYKNRTIPFGPIATGIDLDSRLYNFLGGVQIKNNSSEATFKPFVHALVGAAHIRNGVNISNDVCIAIAPNPCPPDFTEKDTGFAAAVGGGIDIRVSDRIDIRLVQLDYNPTRVFDTTQHTWRFSIGSSFTNLRLSDNRTERGSAGWMFVAYALPGATALGSVRRFATAP